jgi:hypothetical protein
MTIDRRLVFVCTLIGAALLSACTPPLPKPITSEAGVPFAGSAGTASTPEAAGRVSDLDVTHHVKTALQGVPSLRAADIRVVTLKGDVRLTGVLGSQAEIDLAIQTAREAEGTHTIHDELTLQK